VAGAEARGNALRTVQLDADPPAEIVLVAAPDLYVFDPAPGGDLAPTFHRGGVRAASLLAGDLDGDGRSEVLAGAGGEIAGFEARDPGLPGPLPPDGLRARVAPGGAIELAWNPGAPRYRVYRAAGAAVDCAVAQLLAETAGPAYRDSTAGGQPELTYRVSAVDGALESACSAPLTVAPGAAPVVLGAAAVEARAVRVAFSAPMDPSADRLENYRLLDPGGAPLALAGVIGTAEERSRLLVLGGPLARAGRHRVVVAAVRSRGGAPLAGSGEAVFEVPPDLPVRAPLHLVRAGAAGGQVVLELSAAPDSALAADPASYRLSGGLVAVRATAGGPRVELALSPATPLRAGRYRVGLAPALRGALGEPVVPGQGDEAEVAVGSGLVAYPNPYRADRAAADGVTFSGLAAGDRLLLLDPLGREIWRSTASDGGTVFLPVRGNAALASGVYLARVEGAAGERAREARHPAVSAVRGRRAPAAPGRRARDTGRRPA
jgi:hypothetical protein